MLEMNVGKGIRDSSYDFPFLFNQRTVPDEIVMIYIDEASHDDLKQPLALPWDRRLHADLINHLREAGAAVIVFDILFYDSNPEQDVALAAAIEAHGRVVLAGEFVKNEMIGADAERLLLPNPVFREASAQYGLTVLPIEPDGIVRRARYQVMTSFGPKPSLSLRAYQSFVGDQAVEMEAGAFSYINYYGASGTFPAYSYSSVLNEEAVSPGVFDGKIVIVGSRQGSGLADSGKDSFAVPSTYLTNEMMPGMEIHATLIGSMLDGSVLQKMDVGKERLFIFLVGIVMAIAACRLSPIPGILSVICLGIAVAVVGCVAHTTQSLLFTWTVPVVVQLPVVIIGSLLSHFFIEYSARWRLRRAFGAYMSSEQAKQIDEGSVSLELGGSEVEATILFSDLAGFTSLSEGLPPQSVSKALISYFEGATQGILENKGTIIKYIGDAVMATWGAPLQVDREADRAIDAAIQMQVAGQVPVTLETETGLVEETLETRIGINTGLGLAGNLGSRQRFDYTVIGDATNLAARLEGLNKMTGTSILIAQSVLDKCVSPERYLTREVGRFVVKGRSAYVSVHEVIGLADRSALVRERSQAYLKAFESGRLAFVEMNLSEARVQFEKAIALHDRAESCPACELFLDAITTAESDPCEVEEWRGAITMTSK